MAQAQDAVWLPVLPSMKGFGPALVKGAGSEADKAGKGIGQRFGSALVGGVAVVGAGAVATGAALYKVGKIFDEVSDTIRTGTGATGKALDGLVDVAKSVGTKVPADFSKIGTVVADVNTRMGLSGKTLETVASQYLEAGRVLGSDVDINKTSAAFNAFKIEGDDVSGALDHLFQVSQATGIGMNELADAAARNAPAMQTLGFSFEETTAMVGSFDKAGLNSSQIMASMSKGLVTLAKDGEQPAEAFKRVQGEISGFVAAGDEAAALNLASKVFGTRGATQFIGALKSGALNLEDMSKAAGQTEDSILGVGAETMDFTEQWQMFKNKVLVWLEPMGTRVFGALGTLMGDITTGVTLFGEAWESNSGKVTASGLPGVFQQLGTHARTAFDYMQNTVIPTLSSAVTWFRDNAETIRNVALVITAILLPALVRMGVASLISGAQSVSAWVMTQAAAIKTGIIYLAQSPIIIGRWVAMGAAALVSGAQTAYVWGLYTLEAIKGAIAYAVQSARVAVAWGIMSAAAVASGIKTAAVWTGTVIASAASGAASFTVSVARVVGGWVLMGVQSLIHAARMAAAWLIAMGPVGWVIAAVIGLAAIIIANWDKISTFTRDMWERHIKPVFDTLANFITKNVPDAFNKGVGFIREQWQKLQDIAKVPVKFVVEQVINKGLIAGLNNIGGFVGLPRIPDVPLPPGFADGGYTGPGRKKQPAGIVHAGEVVWSQDDISRWGGVGIVEALRKAKGYFTGGLVHPLPNSVVSSGYGPRAGGFHNGIDFAAPAGTPVRAAGPGRVSQAAWSNHGGGNEVKIDHPNGLQTWYAHLSSFAVKLGQMVNGGTRVGGVGTTGNSTGNHLHFMVLKGGWPNYIDPTGLLGGGGDIPADGRPWNPIAGIIDGLMAQFKAAFPGAGFMADLAIGAGKKLMDTAVDFITGQSGVDKNAKGNAGSPYLHDQGGVIPPGLSQVMNRTRKPEALLNPQQWADIHRLAVGEGDRPAVSIGTVHVRDEHEMVRLLRNSESDAQAVYQ